MKVQTQVAKWAAEKPRGPIVVPAVLLSSERMLVFRLGDTFMLGSSRIKRKVYTRKILKVPGLQC
jgi:hypothetical protein